MKKTMPWRYAAGALGTAALAWTGLAQAQSNVQIYGLMDVGVEHLSTVQGNQPKTRMPTVTGGQMASRLGFRGTEDLGNGLKAVFVMEAGISPAKGNSQQSGRMFGRQSYIGLSSNDWGTLSFGRQYLMSLYALQGSDLMGPAVFGLGSLDAYIPNQRVDNSVVWRGTWGAWTLGAAYSLARDGAAPSNCGDDRKPGACGAWSALVKYDAPTWGLALAQDSLKGTAGSGFFGQPSGVTVVAGSRDDRTLLTGYVKFGDTRVGAGWIRHTLKAQPEDYRSNQYYLAVSQPLTAAFVLDATYTYLDARRADSDAQLVSLRLNYNLSKRTALYALVGRVFNGDAVGYSVSGGTSAPASPGLGRDQTGYMIGMRHSF
ncbi:MAG: Outer membrane porin protein 32 [Paracidovorax wautersii]|uniref:Outer membrane porin protein 32 n=1 Tax=Paracidovorax wautersii TaxID=1177982 RepID=A0A7V8FMR7_9BURK|nr:MAG: Outer membrane porin protein 32 [Paracidovorax wautersii]